MVDTTTLAGILAASKKANPNTLKAKAAQKAAEDRVTAQLAQVPKYIPSYAKQGGITTKAANTINAIAAASGLIPGAKATNLPYTGGASLSTLPSYGAGTKTNLSTGATADNGFPISDAAGSLYVDPTEFYNPALEAAQGLNIDPTPIYQPIFDLISQQRTQANERYGQNKADIANIFGQLTQVRQADSERIKKQFEDSIASQQMNLAQRTAEARVGSEQTMQAAQAAGAERGGGPAGNLAASPVQVAAEQGIADANAYQTTWEGMQNAIQQQTQQNLASNIAGYGFQELSSVRDLQNSLENTLNTLSTQEAQAQSQLASAKYSGETNAANAVLGIQTAIAEAKYGGKSKVAEANYNEYLAKIAAEEAQRLATIKGQYSVEAARIAAANRLAVAQENAKNRTVNYANNSAGVTQFMRNEGADDNAIGQFWAGIDSADYSSAKSSTEAYQMWIESQGGSASAGERAAARLFFDGIRYYNPSSSSMPDYGNVGVNTPSSSSSVR